MLSAWSASFLAGMTRISREMNHRACRERRRSLLPTMRLRLLPSHSFRHFRFTLANRITSLLPTIQTRTPLTQLTKLVSGTFDKRLQLSYFAMQSLNDMNDLNKALDDITSIRRQVAHSTEFRGYGPATLQVRVF